MFRNQIAPLFADPATDTGAGSSTGAATVSTDAAPIERASIFKRAVCVQLQISRLGTRRKIDSGAVQTDADRELVHVSADILKAPELEAIKTHDRALAEYIKNLASGPAIFKGGVYMVALSLIEQLDAEVMRRLATRAELVEKFLTVYETRRQQTSAQLASLADRVKWPTLDRVRASFDAEIRYLALDTPETLKGIKAEIFERERVKAEREWSAALDECRQVLRAAFADLVEHLADRLTPGENGKPKIFRDSLVKNMDEFLSTFQARNIADDAALAELVERARGVMRGVSAQDLRDQDALRAAVAMSMKDIKSAIDPLVTDRPSRAYNDEE